MMPQEISGVVHQLPLWRLVFLTLTTLSATSVAVSKTTTTSSFKSFAVQDVTFTEDLLWSQTARSKLDCSLRCAGEQDCAMFTFQPYGDEARGSCRIHSRLQTLVENQQQKTPAPGARSYRRVVKADYWIGKNCSAHAECTAMYAACFSGQCLCNEGYLYDYTENACVTSCTTSLGDKFVQYKDMTITGMIEKFLRPNWDPLACQPPCIADPQCIAFAYDRYMDRCYVKGLPSFNISFGISIRVGITTYQRTCA